MNDLPRFLLDLISSFPRAGDGVHQHLFRLARYLHALRYEREIFGLLRAASDHCGRRITDQEIHEAITHSKPFAWQPGENRQVFDTPTRRPAWPVRQHARIDELFRHGLGLYDLWETSPIRLEGAPAPIDSRPAFTTLNGQSGLHTEQIIDALFPDNPLLCVARTNGKRVGDFATRKRDCWRGCLSRCALMVPSPMARVYGRTRGGNLSQHALEAVGRRRFLVVEFDFCEKARDGVTDSEWAPLVRAWGADGLRVADACAALLAHLAGYGPLTLAVHSGGKSLHGWFYCTGKSDEQLRPFMAYAHALGADLATWNRHQFVRMPDGTRENLQRQAVYFFNPVTVQ